MRTHINIIVRLFLLLSSVGCTVEGHYQKIKNRDIAYLWSLARYGSTPIKEDMVIGGTVVANDKLEELTHSIVVADESGGIEIVIDAENINRTIPLFCYVEVAATGLYVGRQGDKCLLGMRPTGSYMVDRIAEKDVPLYITPHLDRDVLRAKQMIIGEIESRHLLHYIYVDGVRFIDEEATLKWCDRDTAGQYMTSIRHLTDGVDTLRVVCSKECRYAGADLPTGRLTCYGVVDYVEGDIALRISNNQVLRSDTR